MYCMRYVLDFSHKICWIGTEHGKILDRIFTIYANSFRPGPQNLVKKLRVLVISAVIYRLKPVCNSRFIILEIRVFSTTFIMDMICRSWPKHAKIINR